MYAVVWWLQAKSWSIIDVATIVTGDIATGQCAYALHKGTPYEVRILRLADTFDELKAIQVDTDGKVVVEKALLPGVGTATSKAKKQGKNKSSVERSSHQDVPNTARLSELAPVYMTNPKFDGPLSTSSSTPTPYERPPPTANPKFDGPLSTSSSMPTPYERHPPTATPEVLTYLRALVAWLEGQSAPQSNAPVMPGVSAIQHMVSAASSQGTRVAHSGSDDLPFPLPRIMDPTLLYVGHEVEMSKALRATLLRKYSENPEEMTRQLVSHLVGCENLKLMRPRSHGESKFQPIPGRIMAAIDDFVLNNSKLSSFTKAKLTKVISNFANKLRNPDRGHKTTNVKHSAGSPSKKSSGGVQSSSLHIQKSRFISTSDVITAPRTSPWKVTVLNEQGGQDRPGTREHSISRQLFSERGSISVTHGSPKLCYQPVTSPSGTVVQTHNTSPWKVVDTSPWYETNHSASYPTSRHSLEKEDSYPSTSHQFASLPVSSHSHLGFKPPYSPPSHYIEL